MRLPLPLPAPDTLAGRSILITGAAGAMGRVATEACLGAGAEVILLDRNVAALETLRDEILARHPGAALALLPFDLAGAGPEHYRELATTLERHTPCLDGLLHSAAHLDHLEPLACLPPERWFQSLQVNLHAPYLLVHHLLPLLQRSDDASVVFTSDSSARRAEAYWGAYGVSKVAVEALARILGREWQVSPHLRANVLVPGPVASPMRHRAFPGTEKDLTGPHSLAKLYVYLLGPESRDHSGQVFTFQDENHVLRSG